MAKIPSNLKIKMGFEPDKQIRKKYGNIGVSVYYEGKLIKFKSKLEWRWANHLEILKQAGEITSWGYETHTFKFDNIGIERWIMDFEIRNVDNTLEYCECKKGFLEKSDVDKLRLLNKERPEVKVTYVFAAKPKISTKKWEYLNRFCARVIVNANKIFRKEPLILQELLPDETS